MSGSNVHKSPSMHHELLHHNTVQTTCVRRSATAAILLNGKTTRDFSVLL